MSNGGVLPDLSHVLDFPPQPSTLIGGLLAAACIVGSVLQPELTPILGTVAAAGLGMMAIPDNTSLIHEHVKQLRQSTSGSAEPAAE